MRAWLRINAISRCRFSSFAVGCGEIEANASFAHAPPPVSTATEPSALYNGRALQAEEPGLVSLESKFTMDDSAEIRIYVTSVGQHVSPLLPLKYKLRFPFAQFKLRLMHWTNLSVSIEAENWVSWPSPDVQRTWRRAIETAFNSSFCAVTAVSKSRWPHGGKEMRHLSACIIVFWVTITTLSHSCWLCGVLAQRYMTVRGSLGQLLYATSHHQTSQV